MKFRIFLKFSFLVFFLYLLIIIIGLIVNANQLLLVSLNTLTPLKISNADEFRIHYHPFSIEFEQFDFRYFKTEFSIHQGSIFIDGGYFSPSISKIKFSELNIIENNEEKGFELEKRNNFNLKEYSPSVLFESYQGLDISIGKLNYQQNGIDQLRIQDLIFKTRDKVKNPYLFLSLTLPDFYQQTLKVESRVRSQSLAELSIRNNENTDIKATLNFDTESNDHIKISGDIEANYGPNLALLINEHVFKENILTSMEGSLFMNFNSISDYEIDLRENLAEQIHSFSSTIKSKQTTSLNKSLVSSFRSAGQFSLDLISNGDFFDAMLKVPETISVEIKPNKADKHFKENKTLGYLAKHQLILKLPAGDTLFLNKDSFRFPDNISLNWSQKGNPAYLDINLNQIHGIHTSQQIKQVIINYTLSGRWNKYFSSEHQNIIGLNNITPEYDFDINMKAYDKRLHTDFILNGSKLNNHANGTLTLKSKNWRQDIKYLNEVLAFWNPDLKVIDGEINLSSEFSANNINDSNKMNLSHQGYLNLKQVDLDNDGFIFNDITLNTTFKGKNQILDCDEYFPVTVPLIDAGFIIKSLSVNASCHFDLNADSYMDFSELRAKLFGGEITNENFRLFIPYNANTSNDQPYHGQLLTQVKDIQLKEVLAVMENPEVQGVGLLYGELPIRFDENVTLIENGWIKNSTPGALSYKPNNQTKAMLRQNPQMKLMVDVLGNLDYHKLHAKINLNNQGTLSIQGELMGVNKKYKSGAPISFNPNVELNFTDLIKSLQISDNISQSLDNKVNEKKLD